MQGRGQQDRKWRQVGAPPLQEAVSCRRKEVRHRLEGANSLGLRLLEWVQELDGITSEETPEWVFESPKYDPIRSYHTDCRSANHTLLDL